jgi:hypothetical protein
MNRKFLVLVVAAAAAVVLSAIAADSPRPESSEASKQLESLLQERRDTCRKLVEYVELQRRNGQVDIPSLIGASNQLVEAELDMAKTKAERIALRQKLVANLKQAEEYAEGRNKMGFGVDTAKTFLETKAARLKAEIELAREQLSD